MMNALCQINRNVRKKTIAEVFNLLFSRVFTSFSKEQKICVVKVVGRKNRFFSLVTVI